MPYLLWTGSWISALSLNLILLLRLGTGDRYLPVRLFDYFTPWFFCLLFPFLLLALADRCYWLAFFLMLPTLYVISVSTPNSWRVARVSTSSAEHSVRVISHNIWSHNHDSAKIVSIVKGERPDLVLLQEVLPERYAEIQQQLQGRGFSYESVYESHLLQAVFSRFPVESHSAHRSLGQALRVNVTLPGGQNLTIFNIHPLRRGGWEQRHKKIVRLLKEEVSVLRGPVIVAGDFNTTERTETYRVVSSHLHNAYERTGRGFGFTFPAPGTMHVAGIPLPPMVRIDHIFYNEYLSAVEAKTLRSSGGSDHLPVFAELALKWPFPPDCFQSPENRNIGPDI